MQKLTTCTSGTASHWCAGCNCPDFGRSHASQGDFRKWDVTNKWLPAGQNCSVVRCQRCPGCCCTRSKSRAEPHPAGEGEQSQFVKALLLKTCAATPKCRPCTEACFCDKEWRKAVLGVAHGAAGQNRSEHGGAQEPQHMAGGGAVHKDRGCPAGAPLCGLPGTLVLPIFSSNLSK